VLGYLSINPLGTPIRLIVFPCGFKYWDVSVNDIGGWVGMFFGSFKEAGGAIGAVGTTGVVDAVGKTAGYAAEAVGGVNGIADDDG
jgi:hypothetical protein